MEDLQGLEVNEPMNLSEHPSSGPVPTPQNIVSRVFLDCYLDLKYIASRVLNREYNPKLFPAVIMKLREPKTKVVLYASGMLVCLGANSEGESKLATRKYARIIQKLGYDIKFKDFKVLRRGGTCEAMAAVDCWKPTSFCLVATYHTLST